MLQQIGSVVGYSVQADRFDNWPRNDWASGAAPLCARARQFTKKGDDLFYGWKLLIALCGIYFLSTGTVFYGFSVVLPVMMVDMGWSRTEISLGFSALFLMSGVSGPLVALSIGRLGARRTIAAGGAMAAAGAVGVYFVSSLIQFYIFVGLLIGVGMAMQTIIPGTQVLTSWFARRRALALGVFMAMGGAGAFVAAPAFSYLVEATGEWRVVWLVMAVATSISSLIALALVRNRPEDIGTFVDGIDPSIEATDTQTKSQRTVHQTKVSWEVREAIRTPAFWIIVAAASCVVVGGTIVNSQGVVHLRDIGISPVTAGATIGTVGMLSACGRLLTGMLGDRFDPRFLLAGGLALELVAMAMFQFAVTAPLVYTFAIIFGTGNGMAIVASPTLVANYFGQKNYAAMIGIRGLIITPVAAAGPLIAAATFDKAGSYGPAFFGFAALALLPVLAALLMRPPIREHDQK